MSERGITPSTGETRPAVAPEDEARGVLAFFTRHSNASNLLMVILLMGGLYSLRQMNRQFFPSVEIPVVTVSIAWPGAAAADVESQILDLLEPALRELEGVKKITGTAYEGLGVAQAEFYESANLQQIVSDAESAVNRIENFPQEVERPLINRVSFFENITSILVTGPFDEKALKVYVRSMRDELLALGLDRVNYVALRDEEIWVEVSEQNLRRFNLTPALLARRIGAAGVDTPAGTLGGISERQLRTEGGADTISSLTETEAIATADGQKVLLGEIAHLRPAFAERQTRASRNGQVAIRLDIERANSNNTLDTIEASDKVHRWVLEAKQRYPASLVITRFEVQADLVRQRISMLLRNMASGLVLVVLVLFLFLNGRTAFWVSMGIPISMISSLIVLQAMGESINMVSLFAFLMMLGIVVDDAIVVGEEASSLREKGMSPRMAAMTGASTMAAPVFSSSLTTIAAFMPILLLQGTLGQIFDTMAIVASVVIAASLVEAFFILPGHLRGSLASLPVASEAKKIKPPSGRLGALFRFKTGFEEWFIRFRDGRFKDAATYSYDRRYACLAIAMAVLLITVGIMSSGRLGFRFFPSPEGEAITAHMIFAPGTPRAQVEKGLLEAQRVLNQTEVSFIEKTGEASLVHMHIALAGKAGRGSGDNRGEIFVELTPSEERQTRTRAFLEQWRNNMPEIAGLSRMTILERRPGPPGSAIDIQLAGASAEVLKQASLALQAELRKFPSATDIRDDLPYGKREVIFDITPRGYALGFTAEEVGRQLRSAYQGAIARRFTRGPEEITIRVRLHEEDARSLNEFYLTAPSGQRVALGEVVKKSEKSGFARIERRGGARTVSIRGDVAPGGESPDGIIEALEREILPDLRKTYGVQISYGGRAEEQADAFSELRIGLLLALLSIYLILAWVFGHYTRPLAIMSIIPFGLVGTVFGHMVMGYDLSILAFVALLALSGVLVNGSIVLVSRIEIRRGMGESVREASIFGACDRLRAVVLTSVTTILGLLPLLFERSLQAQFLKPIAITLAFGLAVGTLLVLFVVPAILGVQEDITQRRARRKGTQGASEGVVAE